MKRQITTVLSVFILLVLPASSNYSLKSYEFTAGGIPAQSANYKSEGILGQTADNKQQSTNYKAGSGLVFPQQASVPSIALANDARWYNKLKATISPANNPSDTVFAIAVSTDNFASEQYVQSDGTLGATLGATNYQTYSAWGGASGSLIIGLQPDTTFQVRAKAKQGDFTESPWGPSASASTSPVLLSFGIDVAPTDQSSSPPYVVSLGTITPGNIITATNKVWNSIDTNAEAGGMVYVYSSQGGLQSTRTNTTITSASQDLAAVPQGYGAQIVSTTQTSGGPLTGQNPYTNGGDSVGIVDNAIRLMYTTSNAPIIAGRGGFAIKTKASPTTPASEDYSDTLTMLAAAAF